MYRCACYQSPVNDKGSLYLALSLCWWSVAQGRQKPGKYALFTGNGFAANTSDSLNVFIFLNKVFFFYSQMKETPRKKCRKKTNGPTTGVIPTSHSSVKVTCLQQFNFDACIYCIYRQLPIMKKHLSCKYSWKSYYSMFQKPEVWYGVITHHKWKISQSGTRFMQAKNYKCKHDGITIDQNSDAQFTVIGSMNK